MAKRNDTRDIVTSKNSTNQDHFLTVTLYPEPTPKFPWIRLKGLWLAQAGFTPDTKIRVRVMTDCLVITREETPS